jgi:hypothetical protein
MPPGRRPIPSEEERRILEKEAIFRAMIEAGQTTKSFGRPGIGGFVGSVVGSLFEPVIKDLAADAEQQNLIKQYADRVNAEQAPIDYYKSLPGMKQSVLSDMAMGYMPSADAQEGIREQRMANAPYKFPSDWANRETAPYYDYGDYDMEKVPQYSLTGANEKPKFVVGEISQPRLDERDELNEFSARRNLGSNWSDRAIRNLKNGQVLLINGTDNPPPKPRRENWDEEYDWEASDAWYKKYTSSEYVPYMVVVKEDGIVYQREVTPEVYALYKDAMRSGYPVGTEQLLIDEISSLSQQPRIEQDRIFNNIPANQRSLKLLSYILPQTMMDIMPGAAAFVLPGGRQGKSTSITAQEEYIPKPNEDYPREFGNAINVLTHEYGHVFDKSYLVDNPSERSEFRAAATFDMENSSKFTDAEFDEDLMGNYANRVTPGELGATSYGSTSFTEDFAERFAMWQLSDRFGHIAFDRNGNKLTYEDIWPRTARLFEKLMTERPRK